MDGDIAQLVEHLLCMQGALGSIPSISSILFLFVTKVFCSCYNMYGYIYICAAM